MLRGTLLWAGLMGFYVIITLCPASCQLSEDDAKTLVELHNSYRGQVVPNSTYMHKVKWDENLKIIAEGYAVKCIWEHNPDLEELNMGENLFVSNGLFDPNIAMEKWFLEHLDYDYNNNSCQDDKMCGHYTQMVWADSHSVGCAVHRCDTMEGLSFEKATFHSSVSSQQSSTAGGWRGHLGGGMSEFHMPLLVQQPYGTAHYSQHAHNRPNVDVNQTETYINSQTNCSLDPDDQRLYWHEGSSKPGTIV